MGIQDRDYYREHWRKQRADEARPAQAKAEPLQTNDPHQRPPPLWGADWHWSLKVLVWLFIVVLALAARRLLA